jgi:predicted RNA-binding Zn ribbon-like protein
VSSQFRALEQESTGAGTRGEPLCLAFTNTVHDFGATPLDDDVRTYADLLAWARSRAAIDAAAGRKLAAAARRDPRAAEAALANARTLRAALYRIFSARAGETELHTADLKLVNAAIRSAMAGGELAHDGDVLAWRWPAGNGLADAILWPIARSAAHLLTSREADRLVECGGKTCSWLVLDTSKNHSRKFCSALGCGNRTRVRRHYERVRAAKM